MPKDLEAEVIASELTSEPPRVHCCWARNMALALAALGERLKTSVICRMALFVTLIDKDERAAQQGN